MTFELTKEYVDHIQELIENRDSAEIRAKMEGLFPADITSLLSELDTDHAKFLVTQLETESGAEIIANLDENDRRDRKSVV